jgi:hypothetical protein
VGNVKLVFAVMAALMLGTGSAYAFPLEVSQKIRLPAQPLKVWAIAGDFCAIKDWHPLVADCQETVEGGTTFRTLTLKDGGTIKEKLLESGDTSYSYEIIESPLPVMNYKAKFRVEKDPRDPQRTTIFWQATFDPKGVSPDDAYGKINDIFRAGLQGIKQKVLRPDGTVRGD